MFSEYDVREARRRADLSGRDTLVWNDFVGLGGQAAEIDAMKVAASQENEKRSKMLRRMSSCLVGFNVVGNPATSDDFLVG